MVFILRNGYLPCLSKTEKTVAILHSLSSHTHRTSHLSIGKYVSDSIDFKQEQLFPWKY